MAASPSRITPWKLATWGLSFAKAGWQDRGGGGRGSRGPSRESGGSRGWNQRERSSWGSGAGRAARIFFCVLLLAGLFAAWFAFVQFRDIPVPVLAFVATGYADPVPPNALAVEDVDRMQQGFATYKNVSFQSTSVVSDLEQEISRALEAIAPGGPDRNVIVLYISGHGIVDETGKPCLLLPDSNPVISSTWVPVSELIDVCEAAGKSKSCTIVMLLDAGRIGAAWDLGIVCNTFAYRLRETLEAAPPRHTVIINSTDGLDVGRASCGLGGSNFGFFVTEALLGAADRGARPDEVVTLAELMSYVTEHVDGWARANRGVGQRPFVLPSTHDTLKVAHATSEELPGLKPVPFQSKANDAGQLYVEARQLQQKITAWQTAPFEWNRLQHLLVRADQLALAGKDYEEDFTQTLEDARRQIGEIRERAEPPRIRPTSLKFANRLDQIDQAHVDDATAAWTAWLEDKQKDPVVEHRDAAELAAWQALTAGGEQIPQAMLNDALHFVSQAPAENQVLPTEMILVGMLTRHVDWPGPISDYVGGVPRELLVAWEQSEALAATVDPRLHYWIRKSLDAADDRLLGAVDQLLIGDDVAVDAARASHSELLGPRGYSAIESRSRQVERAFELRDRSLSVAAQLGQWLERRAAHAPENQAAANDVYPHVVAAFRLAAALDPAANPPRAESDDQDLERAVESQELLLERLLAAHNAVTVELRRESRRVGRNVGESELQIRAPLDMNEIWQGVREYYFKHVASDGRDITRGDEEATATTPDRPALESQYEQHIKWLATTPSPATELLRWSDTDWEDAGLTELDPPLESSAAEFRLALLRVERLGGAIRERLSKVARLREKLMARFELELAEDASASAVKIRQPLDRADVLTRAAGSIAGGRTWRDPLRDPARVLQRFDLQSQLLWHAERAIHALWGPLERDGPPLFAQTARVAIEDAAQVFPLGSPRCATARDTLATTVGKVRKWNPLVAESVAIGQDTQSLRQRVSFIPTQDLESGVASVFLARSDGLFPWYPPGSDLAVRRQGLAVSGDPAAPHELAAEMHADDLRGVRLLDARTIFRGHVRTAQFNVEHGIGVEFNRRTPGPTSIVVRGDSNQTSQIIVILDCSGSMGQRVKVETPNGIVERSRHVVAKGVLKDFLTRLHRGGERFVVGLMFYGHRTQWIPIPGGYRIHLVNPQRYNGHPNSDVAMELHPVRLDDKVLGLAFEKLNEVEPHGETPLYFALQMALKSFDDLIPGPRHIIAVTDGINDQSSDPNNSSFIKTKFQDVINATNREEELGHDIQIDIIEFGESDNLTDEEKLARVEMRKITGEAEGKFYPVNNEDKLVEAIQNSLKLATYTIEPSDRRTPPSRPTDLGQTLAVDTPVEPREYRVLLDGPQGPISTYVTCKGGEAFELEFDAEQNQLLHRRFYDQAGDHGRKKQEYRGYFIAAHSPDPAPGNAVTFRVSVQQENRKTFPARPELVWATIRPPGGQPYFFFDADFEDRRPVPVFRFEARQWPAAVQDAEIEFAFAMDAEQVKGESHTIDLGNDRTIPGDGYSLQVTSHRPGSQVVEFVIEETHEPGSEHYPLHLQLEPPADSISRTFASGSRFARHRFRYKVPPQSATLRARTRQQIREFGVAPNPIQIQIPLYRPDAR